MKEDAFRKAIVFREEKVRGHGPKGFDTMVTASIEFHAQMLITESRQAGAEAFRDCKEKLCEMLLREVYEDRRKELSEAIYDLLRTQPMASAEAIDRLLKVAKRQ